MRRFTFTWTPDNRPYPHAVPIVVNGVLFVESGEVATDWQQEESNIGITAFRSITSMFYRLNEFGDCSEIQWIDEKVAA